MLDRIEHTGSEHDHEKRLLFDALCGADVPVSAEWVSDPTVAQTLLSDFGQDGASFIGRYGKTLTAALTDMKSCAVTDEDPLQGLRGELYPGVVDGREKEGGVPSRLLKTEAGVGRQEGTPWRMFAGSPPGRTTRSQSRWMSSLGRALVG